MPQSKTMFKDRIKKIMADLGLLWVILIFCIVMSFSSPAFFTLNNLLNLLIQSTILCTVSLGATFVIITGGIDLSVGSVMAVSSSIGLGLIMHNGWPVALGILVMLFIGAIFGLINGVLVTRFGIPPMIVTLATMGIARGLVLIYTNSANIAPVPPSFQFVAYERFLFLPVIVWIVFILGILAWLVLSRTVFGRSVYASGGNNIAARLAGIKTRLIVAFTYVISGIMAAIGGFLLAARLESAGPNAGVGIEMNVIAAVVIGGCSLFGGRGTIFGTVLGVILISLVSNAVNLLGVPPAWDQLVKGMVIIVASLLDVYRVKYTSNIREH